MLNPRQAIASQVRRIVGSSAPASQSPLDHGDAGLFGPSSACWKVHGDFTSMMVGGVAALLLQMLHPAALAGVWDHSRFRQDMSGRLRRTAGFIAGTTYGSTEVALGLIDQVRAIHERVKGQTADGTPYAASDPALLTWVHVCEAASFLAAYRRYREPGFPGAEQDRYLEETAEIARRLGAGEVPQTRAAVADYLRAMRPSLRADSRTREAARAILSPPNLSPAVAPFAGLFSQASQDLLPDWAAAMHGLSMPATRRPAVRLGVAGVGGVLRWALQNGAESRARRRVGALDAAGVPPQSS
jgi:uncharacterized protein (DUF2236 family)